MDKVLSIDDTQVLSADANLSDDFLLRLNIEMFLDHLDRVSILPADERQHLGKLLCTAECKNAGQQDSALSELPPDNRCLNEIRFHNNSHSFLEKSVVVEFQQFRTADVPISGEFPLGNILIANGNISRPQLEQALSLQRTSGLRLGEELIIAGHANSGQVEKGLLLQRKLIACALAVSVGLAPIASNLAEASQTSAALGVSVTVVAHSKLQTYFQSSRLNISNADVIRGYINVDSASRFSVVSNSRSGYLLEFNPVGNLFESVQITGLGSTVQLGADGGTIVQRGLFPTNPTHELSFRFSLRPDVLPGNYPWPLGLSVRSI